MLDIKFIRENEKEVQKKIAAKGSRADIGELLKADEKRRKIIAQLDEFRAKHKKSEGRNDESVKMKLEIKEKEKELEDAEGTFGEIMSSIPNLPFDDVPVGKDARENVTLREVGKKTELDFQPKEYLALGENLHIIEVKRAAKISGSRFGYLKHEGAMLELALVSLAFDTLYKEGFTPVVPPVLIEGKMMEGMGFVDDAKSAEEIYHLEKDDLYLVGTSEQSVIPSHSNETLSTNELPHRHVAFSTCFRREAGSYGKDTKGILRVHQFDKVEMLSITKPEDSKKEHEFLLSMSERLMQMLKIPYRVVALCTGDLSKPSAKTYDIESWLPGSGEYRETHSISNTTDFQARRLGIKYKDAAGKSNYAHILNGTAFAIGRTLIAILENYQQKDGSVLVPEVLQKYLPFSRIEQKKSS